MRVRRACTEQGKLDEDGDEDGDDRGFMRQEAVRLPENCPACGAPGESLTCMADIPHFKEVTIMAFDCEACGFKSSDVSPGSESVSALGKIDYGIGYFRRLSIAETDGRLPDARSSSWHVFYAFFTGFVDSVATCRPTGRPKT